MVNGRDIDIVAFQFPTSGKGHSDKAIHSLLLRYHLKVSIPYEREGTFRQEFYWSDSLNVLSFQFPTSGKGHSDESVWLAMDYTLVFQFPTSGKGHSDAKDFFL